MAEFIGLKSTTPIEDCCRSLMLDGWAVNARRADGEIIFYGDGLKHARPGSPIAIPLECVRDEYMDDRPTVLARHKPELSMSDITMPRNKPSTAEVAASTNESVQTIIGSLHDVAACVPAPKWIEPAHYMRFELEREEKKMAEKQISVEVAFNGAFYVKLPAINNVIFNGPATIVMWADDDKTVVKCQEGDTFSKETGLAMAIAKKALGNKGRFNETFKQWIPEYGKSDD